MLETIRKDGNKIYIIKYWAMYCSDFKVFQKLESKSANCKTENSLQIPYLSHFL